MDHFEARNYNGMDRGEDDDDRGEKKRNYKLTADPLLKSGPQKVYRFDGYNPSDPMPIIPRDPRSRLKRFWTKRDALHLPVPKFKYDQYYVGTILPKEVTFTNLNDNINKQFLKDMCFRFGNIEDCMIFYHPTTKKHMGMGKVLFTSTRAARNCVNKLDSTTKMGNVMTVFLDSMGKERQRLIEEMTGEKQARQHHHHHQKTSPSSSKGNRKSSHSREPSTPRQPQAPVTPTPRSTETFNTPSSQEVSTPNSAPVPLNNGPAGFLSPPEIPAFMPPVVPPPGKPPPAFTMPPPPIGPHLGPPPDIPPFPPPIDTSQPPPPLPPTHFPPPPPHEAFNQFVPNLSCPPPTHLGMQPGMPQPPVVVPSVQSGSSQVREEQHTPQHYNSRTANQPEKTSNNRSYRDNGHRKDSHRDGEGGEWRDVEEGEEEGEDGGRWYKESRGGSRSWERDRHRDRYKDRYYEDDEEENDRDSYDRDDRHRHRKHRRHKHRKDRHRDRHRDRDRRDHHRRHSQEEEEKRIENEPVVDEWQSSPAPPPKVEEEAPPPKADSPEPERHMSLESRIQSLLGVSLGASFGSGEEESGSAAETIDTTQVDSTGDQPPLPVEDDPPLPPVEDEPPPLPPEPAPHENITDVHPPVEMAGSEVLVGFDSGTVAANHTPWMGVVEVPSGQIETVEMENNADDDDRMSLSSLSSGDEKLEVMQVPSASAAYTQYMTNYHNNSLMQNAGMGVHCAHMYQQHFQMDNEQARIHQLQQSLDPHDEEAEKSFLAVLEQVITELKFVMRKDLQKKMVETSAFKSLETWWDSEDSREKTVKLSPLKSPPLMPGMKQPGFLAKPQDTRLVPSPPPKKETKDMSETLASLFDHKDDSMGGFGMGGLLGIRGGIPKLPSFRRPKFRPATPPEDEGHDRKDEESDEDEEKGYKGPCTPEDSGNEAKGDSSESEGVSDSEEEEEDRLVRARKPLIGSDESDWESEKPDESEAESESAASSSSSLEEDSDEASDESDGESDAASSSSVVSSDDEAVVSRPRSVSRDSRSSSRSSSASELSVADRDKESGASLSQEESRSKMASPSLSVGGSSLADVSDTESILDRAESVDMKEAESDKSSAEEGEITEDDEESQEATDEATAAREPDDDALMDVDEAEKLREADEEEKSAAVAVHKVEEEDAAMALLEMQSPTQRLAEAPPPPSEPSQADLEAAQVAREAALAAEAKRNELSSMQAEHNYFAPPVDSRTKSKERAASDETDSASEGEPQLITTLPEDLALDHPYCQPYFPVDTPTYPEDKEPPGWMDQTKGQVPILEDVTENFETVAAEVEVKAKEKAAKAAIKRPRGNRKLTDVTNLDVPRELANLLPPPVVPPPVIQFKARSLQEEMQVTYEFLFKGIDQEDVEFIKQRYEELLQDDGQQTYWLNDTHWVDHSHTRIPDPVPPKKRRKYSSNEEVVVAHKTGCARTEGYYKISHQEKYGYLKDFCGVLTDKEGEIKVWESTKKKIQISREARSESRRWQNVLQSMGEDVGDLFKFNQLKFRKKNLKFAKSGIHDWGLFALEPIAEGEMVIEYVGAVVRQSVADIREKKYEAMGIGSSYMFRIDHETIIDATKCGNLARFINHSCNPNCVAKIITVEGQKKIVIYSKRDIDMNEEITYDYKFPIEDEKISCMCGESSCRGTLN